MLRFSEDSPDIVRLLRSLRSAGCKTFLLTNSGYKFIALGLDHLTRHSMVPGEWRSLFDLVVVGADKPSWYNNDRPFRSLNSYSGKIRWVPITELLPGHVYHGGSLSELNRLMPGFQGQHVLYLGDHVYSDLSKPSRIGWRTGAIIQELEAEVATQQSEPYRAELSALLRCESALRRAHAAAAAATAGDGPPPTAAELEGLEILRSERELRRRRLKNFFNENFGSVFRTHSGATLFTQSILRYSDLYTSHATNLLALSPSHHLFPVRRTLPHEHGLGLGM